ncbi:MFS transporter [Pirellulales bacterium]|nr:MFS transporter [Pirellulales bacterium]
MDSFDVNSDEDLLSRERVSWNQLLAYGSGGVVPIALFNIAGQLMGLLGNISLGLSAFWLGFIMIIPRLWDAVSDPIVGHLSDNTRSRWGRRRPYILFGGVAVAVTFVAMWWIPRGDAVEALFASEAAYNVFQLTCILAGLLFFFTACTVFEIPHGALGMEMSTDYHERTRLFSAKSFLGNLCAMGTPWLIALAGLEFFKGPGGDLVDGMRYVSLLIAAAMIPLVAWWYFSLREPGFARVEQQAKSRFWDDMRTTLSNGPFLCLIGIIFTLAMGFNFVALFNYYISIFYLFGGDASAAGTLLGINGTAWAVTGLLAVFPLNIISRAVGKNKTLLLAILLMCAAQLSKIVCYNPEHPYLVLIPTMFLSSGMLMFFTLGSSMVGDICDEDELKTGTRSEGSYYSVYWWFIKMGTAFASFVTGALLVYTLFDEKQNVTVEEIRGSIAVMKEAAEPREPSETTADRTDNEEEENPAEKAAKASDELRDHWTGRLDKYPLEADHVRGLLKRLDALDNDLAALDLDSEQTDEQTGDDLADQLEALETAAVALKQQSPRTMLRLRVVEIGLPLVLSVFSILLTLRYPLTEARCYEIKEQLKQRRESQKGVD